MEGPMRTRETDQPPRITPHQGVPTGLDTDLLRSFVLIAEGRSFTHAAAVVGRTQSAVSMQMRRLEELLGKPLFRKAGRRTELTEHGQFLLTRARGVVGMTDEIVAAFRAPRLTGTVRIGAPDDYATRYLPDIMARFAATHPDVEVVVVCEPSENLAEQLEAGEVDLSLVSVGCAPPRAEVVWQGPLLWVGSRDHPEVHRRDPLPLALGHGTCTWRRSAERALDEAGRRYRVAYLSNSQTGQHAAVLAGLAISVNTPCTLPPGLRVLGQAEGLPALPGFSIALAVSPLARQPLADTLASHIAASFRAEAAAEGLLVPAA
jgi:DNA-binding transcriptional LysR family regulator